MDTVEEQVSQTIKLRRLHNDSVSLFLSQKCFVILELVLQLLNLLVTVMSECGVVLLQIMGHFLLRFASTDHVQDVLLQHRVFIAHLVRACDTGCVKTDLLDRILGCALEQAVVIVDNANSIVTWDGLHLLRVRKEGAQVKSGHDSRVLDHHTPLEVHFSARSKQIVLVLVNFGQLHRQKLILPP